MPKETLKNGNTIEITSAQRFAIPISSKTINAGTIDEKKVFTISGKVKANVPTNIGTIKVSTKDNYKFLSSPILNPTTSTRADKTRGTLVAKRKNTVKDANGNIVAYNYDLIYTGLKDVSKLNKLKYNLSTKSVSSQVVRNKGIDRVIVGTGLGEEGGKRSIIIKGDPNVSFKIGVGKLTDTREDTTLGMHGDTPLYEETRKIISSTEESITNSKVSNETMIAPNGSEFAIISGKLDKTGTYSFIQEFPAVTENTRYVVHFYSTLVKGRLANSKVVSEFSGWERKDNWYNFVISQNVTTLLTLRVTKTSGRYSINGESAGTNTVDIKYRGVGNKHKGRTNKIPITYTLVAPSHTFALASGGSSPGGDGLPVFSNLAQNFSDWTNSVSAENGGMSVNIQNIAVSGAGTGTFTLTFNLQINNYGIADTIMALDLDTVVNI